MNFLQFQHNRSSKQREFSAGLFVFLLTLFVTVENTQSRLNGLNTKAFSSLESISHEQQNILRSDVALQDTAMNNKYAISERNLDEVNDAEDANKDTEDEPEDISETTEEDKIDQVEADKDKEDEPDDTSEKDKEDEPDDTSEKDKEDEPDDTSEKDKEDEPDDTSEKDKEDEPDDTSETDKEDEPDDISETVTEKIGEAVSDVEEAADKVKDTINTAPSEWTKGHWTIIGISAAVAIVIIGCVLKCCCGCC